jgi:hypothetical protein
MFKIKDSTKHITQGALFTAALIVGTCFIASLIYDKATTDNTPPPISYTLPDSCTVIEYDKLGRATMVQCEVNPAVASVTSPSDEALEAAEGEGYDAGYTTATEAVVRAAGIECEQRAKAMASLHSMLTTNALAMCASMTRSLTAQFIN